MNKKYKEEMQEIHASEELIKNTINKINSKNKSKSYEFIRKFAIGAAAMMMVSVTSFATYVAITGNTEILKKIGINISRNYEENKQEIKEQNTDTKFEGEKFDAEIVAISMDSGSAVAEINVKLKDGIEAEEIQLGIKDFKVLNNNEIEINYTTKQSSAKQEDGTYKCFVYISVDNPTIVGNGLEGLFEYSESSILPIEIGFNSIKDENNNIIEEAEWNFKIDLNKPEETKNVSVKYLWEETMIGDISLIIANYQTTEFGNTIELIASQKDCNIDEINKIQKIDFVVKNENGEVVDIVSRVDNITMDGYKGGRMTEIGVEAKLVVDDTTENPNYTIEIVETDEVKITKEQVQKINDKIIKEYQQDDEWVLTADKMYNELVEMSEAEQAREKFWDEFQKAETITLTEEEKEFFNEYLNKPENIGFVQGLNSYENVKEISLLEVFSCGIEGIETSEEEIIEIREKLNIGVDIKIPVEEGIKLIKEKTGVELTKEEFANQMGRLLVDDACYIEKVEMNEVECDMGYKTEDGRIVIQLCEEGYQTSIVTLQKEGDNYYFISNIGEEPVG